MGGASGTPGLPAADPGGGRRFRARGAAARLGVRGWPPPVEISTDSRGNFAGFTENHTGPRTPRLCKVYSRVFESTRRLERAGSAPVVVVAPG